MWDFVKSCISFYFSSKNQFCERGLFTSSQIEEPPKKSGVNLYRWHASPAAPLLLDGGSGEKDTYGLPLLRYIYIYIYFS